MSLNDSALQTAAEQLIATLSDNGCPSGFDSDVQGFQQAYVNAGGNLPKDSNGSSGIDGLYGANTSAALQATINANSGNAALAGQIAPAGCVGAASGGSGGGSGNTVFTNNQSASTTTTSMASMLPTWGWAALGIALLGGSYMVYESTKHPVSSAHKGMRHHAKRLTGGHRRGHARRKR